MYISGSGGIICNGSDGATTRVTFLLQYGSLSNLTADVATLRSTRASPFVNVFTKGQVRKSRYKAAHWFVDVAARGGRLRSFEGLAALLRSRDLGSSVACLS